MHLVPQIAPIFIYLWLVAGEKIIHDEVKTLEGISNIFSAFGYSQSCIAAALASCEVTDQSSSTWVDILKKYLTEIKENISAIKKIGDRPQNCAHLYARGDKISGIRTVYPFTDTPNRHILVYCDQATDGGGWTVIQKRDALPQREDFNRKWIEYALGFGNVTGEFWLGLDNIHALVSSVLMELRVDLEDFEGEKRWAKYRMFHVGDSKSQYILSIGKYVGDAGDSLVYHDQMFFSTEDKDLDKNPDNCAKIYRGGWWHNSCHKSNLNGFQYEGKHESFADGIIWESWQGHGYHYSSKKVTMSVRPKFKQY